MSAINSCAHTQRMVHAPYRTVAISVEGLVVYVEEALKTLCGAHGGSVASVHKRVKLEVTGEVL